MKRRTLLKSLSALALPAMAGKLWAAPAGKTRLLFVFMRGGYDATSLLVPISSQYYYQVRPNIAITKPSADLNSALTIDSEWGLHPALRDSIYPLFTAGQAAFVPFAGTEDISRSHFETQDSIELGQALDRTRDYRSGFLNRLAQTLSADRASAISFTDQLPLIMQGGVQLPNMALRSIAKPSVDARQAKLISAMYDGTALSQQVRDGFAVREDVMKEMIGEMDAANRNAITAKGFELEARRMARLMQEHYQLGFVDVCGWDSHVNQGGASGALAANLDNLGRGLAAYAQEMGAAWKQTVVVVMSEFGRTFRENGNRGTDHGHGTVYWVLGGDIQGGKVHGSRCGWSSPRCSRTATTRCSTNTAPCSAACCRACTASMPHRSSIFSARRGAISAWSERNAVM